MNGFQRFMGGSPAQVLLRLIVISIIVGIVLQALHVSVADVFETLHDLALHVWHMGFGAFAGAWNVLLLGAAVVIPIWLVIRLLNLGRR